MSLLQIADLRALVDSDLVDTDLQKVVNREEAWLARRIGPLAGSRVLRYYAPAYRTDGWAIRLPRPTSAVVVVDAAAAGSTALLQGNGWLVASSVGSWTGPVDVTFTPNDTLEVERVLIELCRLTTIETGYQSETLGAYAYSRGASGEGRRTRASLLASLKPKPLARSIAIVSSFLFIRDPRINLPEWP